jgi:DNA polymerase-3 subunit gamma/tau
MDTETLRQHWPDVLEAVKRERRVAWILLNSASVDSLEGGVLTLAFAREGEAKGFATSGHDQVLTGVLGTMLGLNVRVQALAGTAAGPRDGGRAVPRDPAGPGTSISGRAGSGGRSGGAARRQGGPPGGPGTASGTGTASGRGTASSGPASESLAPGGQQAAKGSPGSTPVGGGSARRGAPSAAAARPADGETSLPDAPPPPAGYDEEWPDDAGSAGGGSGPTGMELIERQLGGTVIEEIEEP